MMNQDLEAPPAKTQAKEERIGEFVFSFQEFSSLDSVLQKLRRDLRAPGCDKNDLVSRTLLGLIQENPAPCFLLPAVLTYLDHIQGEDFFPGYDLSCFEIWLNSSSGLSYQENLHIRGRIGGKWIPREEYQLLFPLGMGKRYAGSHFVTAHASPDVDTTVASFWGWLDAFTARVAEGRHVWNIPGGPPPQVEIPLLFSELLGNQIFTHLIETKTTLSPSAIDLMSQKGFMVKKESAISSLDGALEEVVVVDEEGFYVGELSLQDQKEIQGVIAFLLDFLPQVLVPSLPTALDTPFQEEELVKTLGEKERKYLENYLSHFLGLKEGLEATVRECLEKIGSFVIKTPSFLDDLVKKALVIVRSYGEMLQGRLVLKKEILGLLPRGIPSSMSLEEIQSQMGTFSFLPVFQETLAGKKSRLLLGVIKVEELQKPLLGTVTVRDFCNREETKIPAYLEVISALDHHKASLQTASPPCAWIADVQSSNVLLAEMAFRINDTYSTGGLLKEEIASWIEKKKEDLATPSAKRIFQRLLQKGIAAQTRGSFFIDPQREMSEYLHFLYAIIDDTDLLTKVSYRDLLCVVSLLNRIKSLMIKEEVEVIYLDDLPQGESFVKEATRRILQNEEMRSLYTKVYRAKEAAVSKNIVECSQRASLELFLDTKVQNGCCRVGQTKLFTRNRPVFEQHAEDIIHFWGQKAEEIYQKKPEVDLHLHMISTVAGAEEVVQGTLSYPHQDELWLWAPMSGRALQHVKSFIQAFGSSPAVKANPMNLQFFWREDYSEQTRQELEECGKKSFLIAPSQIKRHFPLAIIRFPAGLLNSRKAMISPYLPSL